MPASIYLTAAQLQTLSDCSEDIVIMELPGTVVVGAIEAWVCLPDNLSTHRNLVIDECGTIIGDVVLRNDEG